MTQYNIAVVGVTGAVGTRMLEQLEESTLPIEPYVRLQVNVRQEKLLNLRGKSLL